MKLLLPLAAALTALPGAALADWKYTRWGMPLKEVLAASEGTAYKVKERKGVRVGELRRLAEARVVEGSVQFIAELYFDKGGKRLELIRYRPSATLSCLETDKLLVEAFGEGTIERNTTNFEAGSGALPLTTVKRVWTPESGDTMNASMFQIGPRVLPMCTMVVKPAAREQGGT